MASDSVTKSDMPVFGGVDLHVQASADKVVNWHSEGRINNCNDCRLYRSLHIELIYLIKNFLSKFLVLNLLQAGSIHIPNPGLRDIS